MISNIRFKAPAKRRGFIVYLIFLSLFIYIYSCFFAQILEIANLISSQNEILKIESTLKPGSSWYLENLLGPSEQD